MDELIFLGFFAALLLFGPWIWLFILRNRFRHHNDRLEERFSVLTQRIYELESTVRNFQRNLQSSDAPVTSPAATVVPPVSSTSEVVERQTIEPTAVSRDTVTQSQPSQPQPIPVKIPPSAASSPADLDRFIAGTQLGPKFAEQIRKGGGIEEVLGKNWLNKLGIVLLVVGIAFFLAYQLQTLGPTGKVLVGYTVAFALLGSGIWFERNDRYRVLARAGIAGGWALLFFTTYAMYHVPAAHVLSSQALDLVLMLAVALAMVWHTLRYDSQVVTGLAFLLAYSTIFISRVNVYSLSAGVILSIGIVLITLRRKWFELEIFGILASYLNHYFWLRPIIEPMGEHRVHFPEFIPSVAILASYWLIYRISYVVRRVDDVSQENVSTVSALLNSVLLLAVLKYQSVHPEWAFWALLVAGAIEITLGQLPITRRRRTAFAVLTTIGAVLLVAAIPFRYSGARVSVLWLLEAEALFLIGIWTREIVFSRLGMLAGFAAAVEMICYEATRVFGRRMDAADLSPDSRVGLLVLGVGAIVLYANAHYFIRRWSELFSKLVDQRLCLYSSYSAAVLAVVALWMAFPEVWTAVAWGALGLLLAVVARRRSVDALTIQANIVAALALLRVVVVNFSSTAQYRHISLRLVTVAAVAILYYVTSHWTGFVKRATALPLPDAYTWAASTLLGVLMWYELEAISVALAWCLFGIVLFEIGIHKRLGALRWQAYVAFSSSFLRMFFVNLNADTQPGELSPRVYSILPLAVAFFYVYVRRKEIEPNKYERWVLIAHAWMGTITIAALVRFELPTTWVVTGWAALVFVLMAVAYLLKNNIFQQQALLLSLVVLFRASFHNFYTLSPHPWSESSIAVVWASFALFASLYFAFKLRVEESETSKGMRRTWDLVVAHPEQVLFFVPLTMITLLLALDMRSGLITVSWGVEAVAVFVFALWVGERSYRLSGLALLLLSVGKIVVVDVWGLNPRDRYVTLIFIGFALILVSFLYTRFRETIKQYL